VKRNFPNLSSKFDFKIQNKNYSAFLNNKYPHSPFKIWNKKVVENDRGLDFGKGVKWITNFVVNLLFNICGI